MLHATTDGLFCAAGAFHVDPPGAVDLAGFTDREMFERAEYPRTLDLRRFAPR